MVKIAMVGAGSLAFSKRLMVDILSFPEMADAKITLIDIDRERANTALKMGNRIKELMKAPATLEATLDRERGLDGADFVITMFRVGDVSTEQWEVVPALEKYGLKQTVADTIGFGGVCRAQRTIPVMLDVARDMERLCPDAFLLNYSNPMAMNVWAVYRATKVKVVGLCHSVQGTSKQLAKYINVPYEEISFKTAGINHMAWFLEFKHNGKDAYPALREAMNNPEIFAKDPVRFEIMKHFGYFVTESSRHMAEYVPYFLKHDELVKKFNLKYFDREHYKTWQEQRDKRAEKMMQELESGNAKLERSHEYGSFIIHSILTGEERCIYGNVENTGLIPNLPQGCCVEVPCLVNKNGIQPCYVGELPPQLAALNRLNINVQELAVRAVLERNPEYIYHAAMLDPNTSSVMSLEQIREAINERLKLHRELMPALP